MSKMATATTNTASRCTRSIAAESDVSLGQRLATLQCKEVVTIAVSMGYRDKASIINFPRVYGFEKHLRSSLAVDKTSKKIGDPWYVVDDAGDVSLTEDGKKYISNLPFELPTTSSNAPASSHDDHDDQQGFAPSSTTSSFKRRREQAEAGSDDAGSATVDPSAASADTEAAEKLAEMDSLEFFDSLDSLGEKLLRIEASKIMDDDDVLRAYRTEVGEIRSVAEYDHLNMLITYGRKHRGVLQGKRELFLECLEALRTLQKHRDALREASAYLRESIVMS